MGLAARGAAMPCRGRPGSGERRHFGAGCAGRSPDVREGGSGMTQALNVGMIGDGFMAKAHSNAWR
jgi:hypothetical protein